MWAIDRGHAEPKTHIYIYRGLGHVYRITWQLDVTIFSKLPSATRRLGASMNKTRHKRWWNKRGGGSVSTGVDKGPKLNLDRDKRRNGGNFCGQRGDKTAAMTRKTKNQGKQTANDWTLLNQLHRPHTGIRRKQKFLVTQTKLTTQILWKRPLIQCQSQCRDIPPCEQGGESAWAERWRNQAPPRHKEQSKRHGKHDCEANP